MDRNKLNLYILFKAKNMGYYLKEYKSQKEGL